MQTILLLLRILLSTGVFVLTLSIGLAASTLSADVLPVVTHFLLNGEQSPSVVDPDGPVWTPTRNADDEVTVATLGETYSFAYEFSDQQILTGFPIGHDLPPVSNHLFYNLSLDGYGGLPFGSCLRRGYLLAAGDPTKALCQANENRDLMRVWANRNPNLQNVLIKNVEIKNAFRTYNVVDGVVVQNSQALPHTDTFQSFYTGSSEEDPDWLVIQDSIMRNSDNSMMIFGGTRFNGFLYQNLQIGCDEEFAGDVRSRVLNDHLQFDTGVADPTVNYCTNTMGAASTQAAPVWLVDVVPGSDTGRVGISNQGARVVVIGDNADTIRVTTRDAQNKVVNHPNVRRYLTIEEAISQGEARPPFIELSCAGWMNAPQNCESRSGYLNLN